MKKNTELLKTLKDTFEGVFLDNGIKFIDSEYVKEPNGNVLRIYIDKDGGVDLNSCEFASNLLSDWLDENDPISESYFLEVSSPGAEREIKEDDYINYIGKKIFIKLYKKINNQKEFIGVLQKFDDDKLEVSFGNNQKLEFKKTEIAIVKSQIEL